jgi:hypothetical protein
MINNSEGAGSKRQTNVDTVDSYDFRNNSKGWQDKMGVFKVISVIYKGRPAGMISILDITDRKMARRVAYRKKRKVKDYLAQALVMVL